MGQAQVIVVGNEKGGAGKSTLAIHIVCGLLHAGRRVAILDLDLRQRSMSHFFAHRAAWTAANNVVLPMPVEPDLGDGKALARADEAEQIARFDAAFAEAQGAGAEVILIDTPGGDTPLSRAAHARADQIVTPMNDSFVRKHRAIKEGRHAAIDWVVVTNRLAVAEARNRRRLEERMLKLAKRVGFRVGPGLRDRVIYRAIPDTTVRLANLRSGGIDLTERILATDIPTVRADPKLKLANSVSLAWFGLMINQENGPKSNNPLGKDPRVRRAFELALDRDAINQVVFNGEFVPGNQWVSPQSPYYQKDFPIPKRDIAKAKALMKEAGITGKLTLDYMVNNAPESRAIAEVVQSLVAEAGFDLKLRVVEVATALKAGEDGDFQIYALT
ncbi:MAG: hypothetical protein B7Z42_08095 [Brevundimonas sp. 12-68-7]|nr:MAG: hypothetical protein B7Z42_08095 [Brevundimonas sp. 12-68-7]